MKMLAATVVFDAHHAPPGADVETTHELMRILYAAAESDADTLIEELILEHSAPKQILVVSGDRRLKDAAKRRKGQSIGSEGFLRERKLRLHKSGLSCNLLVHERCGEWCCLRNRPLLVCAAKEEKEPSLPNAA